MLYIISHETSEKACWYSSGISAENIPLHLEGEWNILVIDARNRIKKLTACVRKEYSLGNV